MKVKRGDVVIIQFPFASGGSAKVRPAIVVQNDRNNSRLDYVIVAQITSNTRLATNEPTQVLLDPATTDGQLSGVQHPSAVKCENIATHPINDIRRVIGRLSLALQQQVDDALRASFDLA